MRSKLQWVLLALLATLLAAGALVPAGCSRQPRLSRLTVLVSGYALAYIKNCGCSSGQSGGEVRKARLIHEIAKSDAGPRPADKGKPAEVLVLEIGNFSDPTDTVHKLQSEGMVEIMESVGVQSVGLGKNELRFTQEDLFNLLNHEALPVNAANLAFEPPTMGVDKSAELTALVKPYIIHEYASGYRVGIIHVIDSSIADELPDGYGYRLTPAGDAAQQVLRSHRREANLWLITMADPLYEGQDVVGVGKLKDVLLAIGIADPNPQQAANSTEVTFPFYVDKPYKKAKDLVRVQVYFSADNPVPVVDSQRINISENVQPDATAQKILDELGPRIEKLTNEAEEHSKQGPLRQPVYLGQETCRECHEDMVVQLSKSKHAEAYETLVNSEKEKNAHKNSRCLPCHVVGHVYMDGKRWSGGWNAADNQAGLRDVQCENCHGPGEYHVSAWKNPNAAKPADFSADGRDEFGLQPCDDKKCLACHDEPNSPEFDFNEYWPKIEHKLTDEQRKKLKASVQ